MSSSSLALSGGPLQAYAVRLEPGTELMPQLRQVAQQAMAQAGSGSCLVLTAVGSLSSVTLRLAAAQSSADAAATTESTQSHTTNTTHDVRSWHEPMEVVSLVGTMTLNGDKHLHISLSDARGQTFGGHLMNGTIWTTLELVLGTIQGVSFERSMDPRTGYRELVVRSIYESSETPADERTLGGGANSAHNRANAQVTNSGALIISELH